MLNNPLMDVMCLVVGIVTKQAIWSSFVNFACRTRNCKWVWSGNTTISNCRHTHGTARKSNTTTMRHHEDKPSKATSSFFPMFVSKTNTRRKLTLLLNEFGFYYIFCILQWNFHKYELFDISIFKCRYLRNGSKSKQKPTHITFVLWEKVWSFLFIHKTVSKKIHLFVGDALITDW